MQRLGFTKQEDYDRYLAEIEKRKENIKVIFTNLVLKKLLDLGKNQAWLADKIGVSEGAVSRYFNTTSPRRRHQQTIFEALGLPYGTMDDMTRDRDLDDILLVETDSICKSLRIKNRPEIRSYRSFLERMKEMREKIIKNYQESEIYPGRYNCNSMQNESVCDIVEELCPSIVERDERVKHFVTHHLNPYIFS